LAGHPIAPTEFLKAQSAAGFNSFGPPQREAYREPVTYRPQEEDTVSRSRRLSDGYRPRLTPRNL
jgi:hypothetical protein